jgi:hypothetical protein
MWHVRQTFSAKRQTVLDIWRRHSIEANLLPKCAIINNRQARPKNAVYGEGSGDRLIVVVPFLGTSVREVREGIDTVAMIFRSPFLTPIQMNSACSWGKLFDLKICSYGLKELGIHCSRLHLEYRFP